MAGTGPAAGGVPTIAISVTQDAARTAAARCRSASPGQYGSHGYCGKSPILSGNRAGSHHCQRGGVAAAAWTDMGVPSPRTPRQAQAGANFQLNVVVAEMQRQAEVERRNMHRQLEHLERRVYEQMAAPALGRERWADLQGSVSGLLEEVSALSRRLEGLEEKLLLRTGNCEELVRQRTRELEQQLQAHQQKALLAVSTSEEMSKRHTARLRKLGQSVEDTARRLGAVEESAAARRQPQHAPVDTMRLEARLSELEGQQVSLEDEFRGLMMSAAGGQGAALASAAMLGRGAADCGGGAGEYEPAIRALERDFAALCQRTSAQLDDHSTVLANLRVRTEGHEQRLCATAERLETVVSPPLEALRAEMAQLREHDRQETKAQVEHLSRQLQAVAEAAEEASTELRDRFRDSGASTALQTPEVTQRLGSTQSSQEPRLAGEAGAAMLARLEALEQRLEECLEHGCGVDELAEKADRAELVRLDAALQELSEPLHHLSQRTARGEARSAALERRLEQLQAVREGSTSRLLPAEQADVGAFADLAARVAELECGAPRGAEQADSSRDFAGARPGGDSAALELLRSRVEELADQVGKVPSAPRAGDDGRDKRVPGLVEDVEALRQDLRELRKELARGKAGDARAGERLSDAASRIASLEELLHAKADDAAVDERLSEALGRIESGEEETKALRQQLQQLERGHKALATSKPSGADPGDQLPDLLKRVGRGEETARTLESRLEKLQRDHNALASSKPAAPEHGDKLSELLKRVSQGEETARALESRVEQLQGDHEAFAGDQLSDLLKRVGKGEEAARALESQVESLQGDLEQLQGDQLPDLLKRVSHGEETARALESQLENLQGDLEQLQGDHEALARSKPSATDHGGQLPDLLKRVAAGEEATRTLESQLEQLQSDHEEFARTKTNGSSVLEDQISDVSRRLASGDEKVKELRSELEQPIKKLQKQLEQLRGDHEDLARDSSFRSDLPDRLSDALERIARVEEAARPLRGELDRLRQDTDERLAQAEQRDAGDSPDLAGRLSELGERLAEALRRVAGGETAVEAVRKGLKATESSVADLASRLEQAMAQVEASDAATATIREELMGSAQSTGGAAALARGPGREGLGAEPEPGAQSAAAEVEARVRELQEQVMEELECLTRHQQELAGAARGAGGPGALARGRTREGPTGEPAPGAWPTEELEVRVRELQQQVVEELEFLTRQQQELLALASSRPARVEAQVLEFQRQVEEELGCLSRQQRELVLAKSAANLGAPAAPSARMEAQIRELQRQVEEEFQCLTRHQEELMQVKSPNSHGRGNMADDVFRAPRQNFR